MLLAPMISLTKVIYAMVRFFASALPTFKLAFTIALNISLAHALTRCVKNTWCQLWGSATAIFTL